MSWSPELCDLYSAIEESARVLDVPFSEDKVRSILTTYADAVPNAAIAFRMGTGQHYSHDVDWRFSVPVGDADPYSVALAQGLIESTDHPVSGLLAEITERCEVRSYGVDFGAAGGLKKMYVVFPPDALERPSRLGRLASMPPSVAHNQGFFTRHGLDGDQIPTFAIDYRHRTVNLYLNTLRNDPDSIRSIFRDMELPEPDDQLLRLTEQAFAAYATLSWDSPRIERIAFTIVAKDPSDLPVPMDRKIENFLAGIRHQAADDKFLYYLAMSSTGEEIYKIQSYYQFRPWLNPLLSESDENQDG